MCPQILLQIYEINFLWFHLYMCSVYALKCIKKLCNAKWYYLYNECLSNYDTRILEPYSDPSYRYINIW